MEKKKMYLGRKPFIAKTTGIHGFKYKETFTVALDVETKTPAVIIRRLTQYPNPKDILGDGEFVRVFKGMYYVLDIHGFKLDHFLYAADHVKNQMFNIVEAVKAETEVEPEETEEEDKQILVNQIRTPDGTILVSRHRHDYVTYEDKNGLEYMVDGGTAYLRRNVHEQAPYEEITVYEGDELNFEYFRTVFCRGGRGKDGRQPLTWVPLAEMSNGWIEATVTYEEERMPDNVFLPFYRQEVAYRLANNIVIEE